MSEKEAKEPTVPLSLLVEMMGKFDRVLDEMKAQREAQLPAPPVVVQAPQENEQIAVALDLLRQNQAPREVRFSDRDYQERLRDETAVFPRPVFQNGIEADPASETPETLALVAGIVPGVYLRGAVEIIPCQNNGIDIRYTNRTMDQRMALTSRVFSSFGDLVAKVWAEGQRRSAVA